MTIATSIASHRDALRATRIAAHELRGGLSGDPEALIVGMTDQWSPKQMSECLAYVKNELGNPELIGMMDPVLFVNGHLPTTQGVALMGWEKEPIDTGVVQPSLNARSKPKKAGKIIANEYGKFAKEFKDSSLVLFAGGTVLDDDWVDQMKIFDSAFARRAGWMFRRITKLVEASMAKKGKNIVGYVEDIIDQLAKHELRNVIGGASFQRQLDSAYEFTQDGVKKNSCNGLMLGSDEYRFQTSWGFGSHLYSSIDVTSVRASSYVSEMNGKKASQAYKEELGLTDEDIETHFGTQAFANTYHLLALEDDEGTMYPFVSLAPPPLDGVLLAIPSSKMRERMTLHICKQSGQDILDSVKPTIERCTQGIDKVAGAMIFECCNRVYNIGDKITEENDLIADALGGKDTPYIGFGTGGEFSIKPLVHVANSSIHALAFGK